MLDILLHRVPWSGDKIRLYQHSNKPREVFLGEFWIKIQSGNVLVLNGSHYPSYIRRDLPKWSKRFGCWEYSYFS